jgi:hypothetical protein
MTKTAAYLFLCLAFLLPIAARAQDGATNVSLPLTYALKVGSLTIKSADVSLTQKTTYVHVLFDAFPYRDALRLDSPEPATLDPVVKALVEGIVLKRLPATKEAKVDVVEFLDRDEYGAPRWDSVKWVGKYEVKITKGGLSVRRLSVPDTSH